VDDVAGHVTLFVFLDRDDDGLVEAISGIEPNTSLIHCMCLGRSKCFFTSIHPPLAQLRSSVLHTVHRKELFV